MRRNHKLFKRVTGMLALIGLILVSPFSSTLNAQMGGGGGMGGGQNHSDTGKGMGAMMLASGGTAYRPDGSMLRMDDAIGIASGYMNSLGIGALALDEVEEWEFNYYVVVKEAEPSPYKAFQLIIDKWTGSVMPEPGPNMMWNRKYGFMMNSMSDGMSPRMRKRDRRIADPNMTVTPEAAESAASQFLHQRFARPLLVDATPDVYFGYYTFDVNDVATGTKYGMLSVNGSTGQVWYHTWHGSFIAGKELLN
jgi:hypothetical protein